MSTIASQSASIDALGTKAANLTAYGFRDYVHAHGITVTVADLDRAVVLLRTHCKAALFTALDDARDALSTGMDKVAEATFAATMRLAGIKAAKELVGVAV